MKNFSGSPMPAKANTLRRPIALIASAAGSSLARNSVQLLSRDSLGDLCGAGALADQQQGLDVTQLRLQRRAQRSCRKHEAIAESAPPVHHRDRKVLGERWILQSVIHHDHGRAGGFRELRALDAVARNDDRRSPCEQQRLIADIGGGVPGRIDLHRAGELAAITARQEERLLSACREQLCDRDRGRRLAGAAKREITDADHRNARARAAAVHSKGGDRAIDQRHRP